MMKNIVDRISDILNKKPRAIIAIDGRCGSGKTTLAEELKRLFDAEVIHMDEFFLPVEKRCPERLSKPGENVDHERFLTEVMEKLKGNESFSYRPYLCGKVCFGDEVVIDNNRLVIIEGSYSCHKDLIKYYDFKIFCDIKPMEQIERLKKREGENIIAFIEKWIPMEEAYFNKFNIREKCDAVKL